MAEEITEIDIKKYLVLKQEDLNRFFSQYTKGVFTTPEEQRRIDTIPFTTVLEEVQKNRTAIGKKDNQYLVLNMDDEIDLTVLSVCLNEKDDNIIGKVKVKDLAVDIVNAILLAEED